MIDEGGPSSFAIWGYRKQAAAARQKSGMDLDRSALEDAIREGAQPDSVQVRSARFLSSKLA